MKIQNKLIFISDSANHKIIIPSVMSVCIVSEGGYASYFAFNAYIDETLVALHLSKVKIDFYKDNDLSIYLKIRTQSHNYSKMMNYIKQYENQETCDFNSQVDFFTTVLQKCEVIGNNIDIKQLTVQGLYDLLIESSCSVSVINAIEMLETVK